MRAIVKYVDAIAYQTLYVTCLGVIHACVECLIIIKHINLINLNYVFANCRLYVTLIQGYTGAIAH